jgi:Ca2+-binding EF-hand superfamily protein
MDTDGQRTLSFEEFRNGVRSYGLHLENKELRELFDAIDTDHSGEIDYEEFLISLRVS